MNSFVALDFWTDPTDRTSYPVIVLKENWGPLTSYFLADECRLHISKLLRERQPCEYVNYPWESSKCFLGRWANKPSWNTYIRKCTGVQLQSTDFPHFQRKGRGNRVLEKASLTLSHIRLLYTIVFPMLLTLWAYQLIRCGSRSLQPQWHSHRLSWSELDSQSLSYDSAQWYTQTSS